MSVQALPGTFLGMPATENEKPMDANEVPSCEPKHQCENPWNRMAQFVPHMPASTQSLREFSQGFRSGFLESVHEGFRGGYRIGCRSGPRNAGKAQNNVTNTSQKHCSKPNERRKHHFPLVVVREEKTSLSAGCCRACTFGFVAFALCAQTA